MRFSAGDCKISADFNNSKPLYWVAIILTGLVCNTQLIYEEQSDNTNVANPSKPGVPHTLNLSDPPQHLFLMERIDKSSLNQDKASTSPLPDFPGEPRPTSPQGSHVAPDNRGHKRLPQPGRSRSTKPSPLVPILLEHRSRHYNAPRAGISDSTPIHRLYQFHRGG